MHTLRDRTADERGATIILVAAAMFLIMGIAALVVDFGLGLSERRLDQNVADTAVMGGAIITIQNGDPSGGVDEVMRLVDVNLDRTVTLAEWQACTDPDQLSETVNPAIPCISYETDEDTLTYRVKVPDQTVETTFAKVLGFDQLTTDAFAEATLTSDLGDNILPFGLYSGTTSGTEACLKTTSPPSSPPPPCDGGPAAGQFGGFDPFKAEPGAGFCQATSNIFEFAVAQGVDHPMEPFDPPYAGGAGVGPTNAIVNDWCVANTPPAAPTNTVSGSSGSAVSEIRVGLLEGGSIPVTYSSRLGETGTGTFIDLNGPKYPVEINNEPIWDWFDPLGTCAGAAAEPTAVLKKEKSLECIVAWDTGDDPIFRLTFINSTRLAFVPQYDEGAAVSPGIYHINEFIPIYLQALIFKDGSDFEVHEPGNSGTFSGLTLNALSAIVLECGMLVDTPCSQTSEPGGPFTGEISTLQLSR